MRDEIINIVVKCALKGINQSQSKDMIDARMLFANKELKNKLKPLMNGFCGGDGQYSDEEYDKFYCLWKDFQPFQKEINKLLLYKVAPKIKIKTISKQAIKFLSSITDDDLEILKEQFRYVIKIPHLNISEDLAIYNYHIDEETYSHNFLIREFKELMHLESCSIRFYGDIWVGDPGSRSSYLKAKDGHMVDSIDSQECCNLQISSKVTD